MDEKKKTPRWGEEEAISVAERLARSYDEDCGFADLLDSFLAGELDDTRSIVVGKTPNVLAFGGAKMGLDVIIHGSTIKKCLAPPDAQFGESFGHDLDKDLFKFLVFALRHPVMLLRGSKPNSLVAVTDLSDKEGRPIIIPVMLGRRDAWHEVIQIVSAYGRNNFDAYLQHQIEKGNLLAINRNKANQVFRSTGVQFPVEDSLISFDNSIAYTMENVKIISTKNLENFVGKESPAQEQEKQEQKARVARTRDEDEFEI